MALNTLTPSQLVGLTDKQLAEYHARLSRWKTLQGPWAAHTALYRYQTAMTAVMLEQRRRGRQMSLF